MMRFKIVARRMFGDGNEIVCRRCGQRMMLPKNPHVIMYDDGQQMTVRDPTDRSLRHRCGKQLEWWCPSCKEVSEPKLVDRKQGRRSLKALDVTCQTCGEADLIQREVQLGRQYR